MYSLLTTWQVSAVGWSRAIDVSSNDLCKIQQILQVIMHYCSPDTTPILQKQAVPFKPRGRVTVSKDDLEKCDLILCFEMKTWCRVLEILGTEPGTKLNTDKKCRVKMLADFYPDFHLTEINDPLHDRDVKSYEKSYWQVYKSVR